MLCVVLWRVCCFVKGVLWCGECGVVCDVKCVLGSVVCCGELF